MKTKGLLLIICSIFFQSIQAQFAFTARSSTTEAKVNQPFALSFIVSGSGSLDSDANIDLPNFTGLQTLGSGRVQNFSNVNGKSNMQFGYNITVLATKPGTYTIGSAYVEINGKSYKTQPLKIKVVDAGNSASSSNTATSSPKRKYREAFLRMEVSNKNPFQNEAIVCELRYYAINSGWLGRLNEINPPQSFKGFAVEKVENPNRDLEQTLVGNYVYYSAVVGRYVLIPNQTGTLEIPSFDGKVLVATSFYDDEFATISSDPISIQVKSLPEPKPKDFKGAVGNFKVNVFADKKSAKANESVKVEVELVGNGNLKVIKSPEISVPNEIENYPPKMSQNIIADANGMSGKIVKEHILVPQYGGTYSLSVEPFSYFDPVSKSYKSITSPSISLEVDGPEKPEGTLAQEGEEIHDGQGKSHENYANKAEKVLDTIVENKQSQFWILGSLCALVVSLLAFFIWKKRKKSEENSIKVSESNTNNTLSEETKPEKPLVQEVVVSTATQSELRDKLSQIKPFLLVSNKDKVLTTLEEVLKQTQANSESVSLKNALISQCQIEKYSPITTENQLQNLFTEVENFIHSS